MADLLSIYRLLDGGHFGEKQQENQVFSVIRKKVSVHSGQRVVLVCILARGEGLRTKWNGTLRNVMNCTCFYMWIHFNMAAVYRSIKGEVRYF